MKSVCLIFAFILVSPAFAQHCPWDCSSMVVIQTTVSKDNFYKFGAVLVDEEQKEVVDNLFGTGEDIYDNFKFLSYYDFTAFRKKKISVHHWCAYDTVYRFARGYYIVKFNYCKYKDKKLYIRFVHRYTRGLTFHYIEVPPRKRLHLHNYNDALRNGASKQLKKQIQPLIVNVSCDAWRLRPRDCK